MKVKLNIAQNIDLCFTTQLENTSIDCIKSALLIERFVLLPVHKDTNGLLFTKRLHMMV